MLTQQLNRKDLLALLLLASLAFLFLWRVLVGGKVLLPLDVLYTAPPWNVYGEELGLRYPHNDLIGDMILQNYSWKQLARSAYAEGRFPLWNPYIFAGQPFLAAGQYAALYPLGVIFFIMPLAQAYGWFTALHLFLAGAFMYAYLRILGASWLGGLVSAIAFTYSGFLIVSFLWPMILSTAVWAPLLLLTVELVLRSLCPPATQPPQLRRALLWGIVGALAVALQFLAGHLEISFYLLFTMLFYAALRLLLVLKAGLGGRALLGGTALSAMIALGCGLAALQLLPFAELIRENFRGGLVTYQDVAGYALPKRHLLAFLMPDFFGNPTHHRYFDLLEGTTKEVSGARDALGNSKSYPFWGIKNYVEGAAYVGILPLLLAGAALLLRRDRYTGIFGAYALFALLLAFGTPLYALFFYGVPGFDQLHTPFRWIFPYTIAIAVLAGLGASALWEGASPGQMGSWRKSGIQLLARGAVAAGGLGLGLLTLSRLYPQLSLSLAEDVLQRSQALALAFSSPQMLYSYQFRNLLLLALLLLGGGLIMLLRKPWANRPAVARAGALPFLALGTLVLDLFLFHYDFNSAADPRLLEKLPPSLQFLRGDPGPYRITSFNYDDTLRPNSWMLAGIQDVRGYDTVILRQFVAYWRLMEEPQGLLYSQINKLVEAPSLASPLLDLLNVKYIITTQNIGLPHLQEVYRGEVNIYENRKALPRAFVVYRARTVPDEAAAREALKEPSFDPRREVILEGGSPWPHPPPNPETPAAVQLLSYRPEEVVVEAQMPHPGYLVLSDAHFPGWRAFGEEGELPLWRANSLFRAVPLPQGHHRVTFRYQPESFRLGGYLSLLSLVVLALGVAALLWRGIYREAEQASTLQRILKNTLTPLAAQVVVRTMDLAFAIFMVRYLGPLNVGKYAFAVFLIGYFAILTDFGLGTLLTREVARDKAQANRYLSNTLLLRLGLVVASLPLLAAIVGLYAWRFDLTEDTTWTILLFAIGLVPSSLALSLSALFSAHEKMEYPAAVAVVTNFIKVTLGIVVLLLGWGIIGLAGVSILASLVTLILLYLLVRGVFFSPRLETDMGLQRQMVSTAFPLMINNLLSTVFFRIDVMLLKPMKGDEANGYYTTAYKFIDGLNLIPSLFTLAIFPLLARYAESSREALVRAFTLSLKALLVVALPITVGTTLIADQLILLFFGEAFAPAIGALQILIWYLPFSYINSVTHYVLIAVNQQRFLTYAFFIGATFNIVGNLLLIPVYSYYGAAFTTVLSELVLMVPFFYAVRRHVGSIPLLAVAWRPTLAALAMGLLLWPWRSLSLLALIPLACVIYGAVLLALRTFDDEDWALLRSLRRRPPERVSP